MRILLDECVDWRLARAIAGHEVRTAAQMGWRTIKNGELLALAGQAFDAFEEVAQAIYYLCTEQSSYVTGAELNINGGQHV